jgi:hypothetical protein
MQKRSGGVTQEAEREEKVFGRLGGNRHSKCVSIELVFVKGNLTTFIKM